MKRIAAMLILGVLVSAGMLPVPRAAASTETVLYSFCVQAACADGASPASGLIAVDGKLYGTTYGGGIHADGSLFAFDPDTGTETVLHAFRGADGAHPSASLINVDGVLYGTTTEGGAHNAGTVFGFDPDTNVETVIYSFCSQARCIDGREPKASLVAVNGTLYGTTEIGGYSSPSSSSTVATCARFGCGTVFSLDLDTGQENALYSFCSRPKCADGEYPTASLIDVKGTLYGTTVQGGSGSGCGNPTACGAVFALDRHTGVETVLHSFASNGTDGFNPQSGLIDVNGTLYGTTYYGGHFAEGTVYSLNPRTGAEAVVYAFCARSFCPDGASPMANLLAFNGLLYGTAYRGGTASETCNSVMCGSVFAIDPASGSETTVYAFCTSATCSDGEEPQGSLIDVNGTLYGTTSNGGTGTGADCNSRYGCGTVFAIKP